MWGEKPKFFPKRDARKDTQREPKQIWSNGNVRKLILPNPVRHIGSALWRV